MKTILEIEENPLEFVQWAKAQIAAEHGHNRQSLFANLKANEQESRARGVRFVDYSQIQDETLEPYLLHEDPPATQQP